MKQTANITFREVPINIHEDKNNLNISFEVPEKVEMKIKILE